jgi:hypothetical protein
MTDCTAEFPGECFNDTQSTMEAQLATLKVKV